MPKSKKAKTFFKSVNHMQKKYPPFMKGWILTLCILGKISADDISKYFFLFYLENRIWHFIQIVSTENRIWHFMQIVSLGGYLHEVSDLIF